MKARFTKENLISALSSAMGCVSQKNTISAIEGILLSASGDKCKISSYDLEKGLKTSVECEVMEQGSCVIDAQRLFSAVRAMPSDVTIETDESKKIVNISSNKASVKLYYLSADEFPSMPELSFERTFFYDGMALKKMINQTIYAIDHSEDRPAYCGEFFTLSQEGITIVACDGYRVAVKKNSSPIDIEGNTDKTSFIVPGKTLVELCKLLDEKTTEFKVNLTRKHIVFKMKKGENEVSLLSRLIDAEYIDYTRIIPKESKTFINIDCDLFRDGLERTSLITQENKNQGNSGTPVKLIVEGGVMKLYAVSQSGEAYDEINIDKKGEDITIAFNCRYLLDALKNADDEQLKLSLTSARLGMIVEGATDKENESFLSLILPVRLPELS